MLAQMRRYKAKDSYILCPKATEKNMTDWPTWATINEGTGPAFTAIVDGKPIGAAGIRIVKTEEGEKIGWSWLVLAEDEVSHKCSFFISVFRMMKILMKRFKLSRLITEISKDFAASQRFVEHLGFKRMDQETDEFYYYEYLGAE